jgi:hypothetical protein
MEEANMPNAKKIIYSLRVYLELKEKGIVPVATTENPKKSNFICWIYDKTPELDVALKEIMG